MKRSLPVIDEFVSEQKSRKTIGKRENAVKSFSIRVAKVKILIVKKVDSSPNDTILDWSKFKAFADSKINVT